MKTVVTLALAFLRERPTRLILTSLATVSATCIAVWVASNYDSLLSSFEDFSASSLGRYDLSVAPHQQGGAVFTGVSGPEFCPTGGP